MNSEDTLKELSLPAIRFGIIIDIQRTSTIKYGRLYNGNNALHNILSRKYNPVLAAVYICLTNASSFFQMAPYLPFCLLAYLPTTHGPRSKYSSLCLATDNDDQDTHDDNDDITKC